MASSPSILCFLVSLALFSFVTGQQLYTVAQDSVRNVWFPALADSSTGIVKNIGAQTWNVMPVSRMSTTDYSHDIFYYVGQPSDSTTITGWNFLSGVVVNTITVPTTYVTSMNFAGGTGNILVGGHFGNKTLIVDAHSLKVALDFVANGIETTTEIYYASTVFNGQLFALVNDYHQAAPKFRLFTVSLQDYSVNVKSFSCLNSSILPQEQMLNPVFLAYDSKLNAFVGVASASTNLGATFFYFVGNSNSSSCSWLPMFSYSVMTGVSYSEAGSLLVYTSLSNSISIVQGINVHTGTQFQAVSTNVPITVIATATH